MEESGPVNHAVGSMAACAWSCRAWSWRRVTRAAEGAIAVSGAGRVRAMGSETSMSDDDQKEEARVTDEMILFQHWTSTFMFGRGFAPGRSRRTKAKSLMSPSPHD